MSFAMSTHLDECTEKGWKKKKKKEPIESTVLVNQIFIGQH